MAAITSKELSNRLQEIASQGLIEVREIRKIDEKDHVEIIVKFYGVKGAILNDGAADNYANFVIKCRNLKYKLTPEESEFMENLVLRIMKEQKIDNYISANRVSKLSIDFTVRIVQNSLDALSEKGEIEKNVNGYIYKRVPKSSQSLPSIS